MKWIQTGKQLGKAVKNVQRLSQILGVFARYGFSDFVYRMNLERFLPQSWVAHAESQAEKELPERIRLAFEELGPTFVKLGQLLSTRSDLLPETFIEELTRLQDNVQPLAFDQVKMIVEHELRQTLDEAFAFFDPKPLASASIGQVHEARLYQGDRVVVKVQRPEIEKIIETDISLLAFLASLLEKYVPEARMINPSLIVDEFFRTLSYEIDFIVESNNILKIAENSAHLSDIVIPKVYREFTTHRVLTLEKIEGIRVNDLKAIDAAGIDRQKIVRLGAQTFFKWVMKDGLFHGDLHGGNIFVLPGNRLGIVDFGIVGRLSQKSRQQLAKMLLYLMVEDYENLCYEYAELGVASASIDFDGFQREVRNTLSPYLGLPLADINIGKVLIEATRIATQFHIKVPGDWMLVFKAILSIEGMGRMLDPQFDLLNEGQFLVKDLLKSQYSFQAITKEFLWITQDLANLLKILPRQLRWMLRKLSRNDFAFEIKIADLTELLASVKINNRRLSLSILSAGLFIASSVALNSPVDHHWGLYPAPAVFFCILGCVIFLWTWLKS